MVLHGGMAQQAPQPNGANDITLSFPDGATRSYATGTTGYDVAHSISPSLAKAALAVSLDGELRDLSRPIEKGGAFRIIMRKDEEALELIRHDCAHVMAEAVQSLFPGTQVTIGPNIEHGFYYDFARNAPFTTDDFVTIEKKMKEFEKANDDYSAIMLQALADRLAEAFAEHLHLRVRREFWGYAADEGLSNDDLITEKYRGIRPAPGYPACPEHSEKGPLFELLQATKNADITLTESFAMLPTAAVSGFYFSHPQAQYFATGKVDKDQVADYAKRKGWTVEEAERWLAPVLSY